MGVAVPGRVYTFAVRIPNSVSIPTGRIVQLDPTDGMFEVRAAQAMVELDTNSDIWLQNWDVPSTVDRQTHFLHVVATVGSVNEHHFSQADIVSDTELDGAVAGTDRTTLAGMLFDLIPIMRRDLRRMIDSGLAVIPQLEVDGVITTIETTLITEGDTPLLQGRIFTQGTRVSRDITGATLRLHVLDQVSMPLIIDRVCNIVDGVAGRWDLRLDTADTTTTGGFRGEVEVTFPGGEILTTPQFIFTIQEQLG